MNRKIDFTRYQWTLAPGVKEKTILVDDYKLRFVEFDENFHEQEWCASAHIGYVIEGAFKIEFHEEVIQFSEGDMINISDGDLHKAIIESGQIVRLILIEKKDNDIR